MNWIFLILLLCFNIRDVSAGILKHLVKRQENQNDHRWIKEDFPSPASDSELCGKFNFLCDPARILQLTHQQEFRLRSIVEGISSCSPSGPSYVIAVAIVPGLYLEKQGNHLYIPANEAEKTEAVEAFAKYLRDNKYSYMSGCEELVMIVISRDDRQIYTAVADKARKVLDQQCVTHIYKEAMPHLQSSLEEGLLYVVERYHETFSENICKRSSASYGKNSGDSAIWLLLVGSVLGVVSIFGICVCCCKGACDGKGRGRSSRRRGNYHGHSGHRSTYSGDVFAVGSFGGSAGGGGGFGGSEGGGGGGGCGGGGGF